MAHKQASTAPRGYRGTPHLVAAHDENHLPDTMHAVELVTCDSPLQLVERALPPVPSGSLLVRMEAAGVCRTDLQIVRGQWPELPALPRIPGHAGVGIVTSDALSRNIHIGDRVALPWLGFSCGTCEQCLNERPQRCAVRDQARWNADGTWAEYTTAGEHDVVIVPDGITPYEAAVLSEAGLSTYAAVERAGIHATHTVGIFGIGGLGHLALQYAAIAGAHTIAIDLMENKLVLAHELGAQAQFQPQDPGLRPYVERQGGLDVALICSDTPSAVSQALSMIAPEGTIVLIGLQQPGPISLDTFAIVKNAITIRGSAGGTRRQLHDVFKIHREGMTQVVFQARGLEMVNQALSEMEQNAIEGQLVFDIAGPVYE